MSIKVLTWAFGLTIEPRAKIALLAIADNADDEGVAWPSRDLIAQKSSQSRATVNRRMAYLTELGVCSVHPRFRPDGSQTSDEIRLDISLTADEVMRRAQALKPVKQPEIEPDELDETDNQEVEGGCQPAAPPCAASSPGASDVQPPGYHCGNPHSEPSVEPSVDAADARARSLITKPAMDLAQQLLVVAGHDLSFWPPGWCGAPMRVQTWLNEGWPAEIILAATTSAASRKTGPPAASVQYFESAIAEEIARQNRPVPEISYVQTHSPNRARPQGNAFARLAARLGQSADDRFNGGSSGDG